jgi:hypothetical protein
MAAAQPGPTRTHEEELIAAAQEAAYVYRATKSSVEQQAWEVTKRLIEQMAVTCRARQIRFIVFSVSTSLQVYPDAQLRARVAQQCAIEDLFYAEHTLRTFCSEHDIEFMPLASALQQVADSSGDYLHGFTNARLGIGHWSVAGNQAAAQILADYFFEPDAAPRN